MVIRQEATSTAQSCGPVQEGRQKQVLDINDAAELIGVTVACMRKWKREKRGPTYFQAGRLIRYRRADVENWIGQNTVSHRPSQQPTRAL